MIAFLITAIFLYVPVAYAENPLVLSWQDCLREAKANNPDLVAAREQLNQSKADRAITKSGGLPNLTSDSGFDRSKSTGKQRADTHAYGVNASQLLFDGFKTSYDVQSAGAGVKAAQYNYDVASSNVRLDLRSAFVDLLNAQEFLGVAQNIARRRKHSLDLVALRYQGGAEHRGSLLTAQANWAQAQLDIERTQRDIELSRRRLVKIMGWPQYKPVAARGDLSMAVIDPKQPLFEDMIAGVPFLRQLTARKEAAKFGLQSARADFFPRIYANAGIGRTDSSWPPGKTSWSAGLSLTFSLFEGGARQARVSRARAVLGQAQAEERGGRDGVILTLAETWTQWQDSAGSVEVQKKFARAARERAKIAQAQYASGLIRFNEWIIIENELVNAQKSLLNVETAALIAQANWAQAKGETLDALEQ
ncbi:MAG: TolC family protein [Candidatus Omnitrophica bacterium]|nr:TolC family protein [Candidatus Omnitrophota bacterium]